jgi:site-specific DNA recombinase
MRLVEEYLDFETGRLADKRPGFQRLIEDALEHRFEVVLVFHTSRFARNTVEVKRYKKLLRSELGIDVISVTQPLGADADDPAAFLSESVHEIFDEYYSVSLSFWTKMGLREKARQGKLTGSLPWGYAKGEDEIATPEPEKAPYVRRLFEMYATGQHTDRTLAAWLNVHEQRTTRSRTFGADTVREMLCNAAYCGYVSPRRDKSKAIKGLHEPIVDEALFDRVQELRRQRARNLKPGRPSQRYLLRGLARCER